MMLRVVDVIEEPELEVSDGIVQFRSSLKPVERCARIWITADSLQGQHSKESGSHAFSAVRGLAEEFHRQRHILTCSVPVEIHHAEVDARRYYAGGDCELIPV